MSDTIATVPTVQPSADSSSSASSTYGQGQGIAIIVALSLGVCLIVCSIPLGIMLRRRRSNQIHSFSDPELASLPVLTKHAYWPTSDSPFSTRRRGSESSYGSSVSEGAYGEEMTEVDLRQPNDGRLRVPATRQIGPVRDVLIDEPHSAPYSLPVTPAILTSASSRSLPSSFSSVTISNIPSSPSTSAVPLLDIAPLTKPVRSILKPSNSGSRMVIRELGKLTGGLSGWRKDARREETV